MQYVEMLLGVVLLVSAACAANDKGDKPNVAPVPVRVYYESLCPDSVKFVTKQLYPAFQTFGSKAMDLQLIPYGKSKHVKTENDTYSFDCHHGPNECYGNKVQACALAHLSAVTDKMNFVNCVMENVKLDKKDTPDRYPGQMCADKLNLNYDDIKKCVNSTEGDNELAKQGDLTNSFQSKLESVPTVVFDNMYTKKNNEMAQKDFNSVFCGYLSDSKSRKECANRNSAGVNQAAILSSVVAAIFVKILS